MVSWEMLKARHIPAGMENFPATDDRGWKIIQRAIDVSDYYVLLVAGRYGSIDATTGLSWTEREYRYAVANKIPTLAFIREDDRITLDRAERDATNRTKLAEFKKHLRDTHLCSSWKEGADLASSVAAALRQAIDDDEDSGEPRPGWYRGTQLPGAGALAEFARLSEENRRLKEQLAAASGENRPIVELLDSQSAQPSSVGEDRPFLVPKKYEPTDVGMMLNYTSPAEAAAFLEKLNSTVWLSFRLTNKGRAPARNVQVTFESADAKRSALPREMTAPGEVALSLNRSRDDKNVVFVERHESSSGSKLVMRVSSVGVGHTELLLRFGFVSNRDGLKPGIPLVMQISWRVADENGNGATGTFSFERTFTARREVANKEFADMVDQYVG